MLKQNPFVIKAISLKATKTLIELQNIVKNGFGGGSSGNIIVFRIYEMCETCVNGIGTEYEILKAFVKWIPKQSQPSLQIKSISQIMGERGRTFTTGI